jgi:hypothetical protein
VPLRDIRSVSSEEKKLSIPASQTLPTGSYRVAYAMMSQELLATAEFPTGLQTETLCSLTSQIASNWNARLNCLSIGTLQTRETPQN